MSHKKTLLIDDDPDDQFIFMDATSELETGIECITANNGFEALALLNTVEPPPSLIFLDLNMPGINGFDCLTRIKKEERLKDIPVVIFTTSDNPADKKHAKELGAVTFLTKTPDFKLLQQKLLNIFNTDFSGS